MKKLTEPSHLTPSPRVTLPQKKDLPSRVTFGSDPKANFVISQSTV